LHDFFVGLRGRVRRPVKLVFAQHPDETEGGRAHDALTVDWTAGTRLLPDFHGTVRLRIATVESTAITLEGAWRLPFRLLGRAFNALIGRRVAKATMGDLLDRLVDALELREQTFRHEGRPADSSGITA
jgi:hypothetical protein